MNAFDFTTAPPCFGEIFIINDETQGGLECLQHFKGKLITSLGGGNKKLYVIEDGGDNEGKINYKNFIIIFTFNFFSNFFFSIIFKGIINSLHNPENDDYDYTFNDNTREMPKNMDELMTFFDNKGF